MGRSALGVDSSGESARDVGDVMPEATQVSIGYGRLQPQGRAIAGTRRQIYETPA